jgi:hypothetical protein
MVVVNIFGETFRISLLIHDTASRIGSGRNSATTLRLQ